MSSKSNRDILMKQKSRCLILLLTLLCSGCYNKTGHFTPGFYQQCREDFIDTRILFFEQTGGQNFILDNIVARFIPLVRLAIGYRTTRMQMQMTIRNGYESIKWTVFGEATDRDFNWGAQTGDMPIVGVPVGYTHISPYMESISDLVRKTIRDGFKQLKEAREEHEPWHIAIKEITEDGKIHILFGSSDGLNEGDILPVYAKDDLNKIDIGQVNRQYCQNEVDDEYNFLAIVKIIDIENNKSTLEVILQPPDGQSIQVGDVIKSVNKNKNRDNVNRRRRSRTLKGNRARALRERRNNRENIVRAKHPIRLGFIYADLDFEFRGSFYRQSMGSLVRRHIIKEAEEFDFQILFGRYNNYNPYYNRNPHINYNQ